MSAVMVAPVDAMMARGAMMADDTRTMHRQHPAAASTSDEGGRGIDGRNIVIVGIVIRIVIVIDAADKRPAEAMPVSEGTSGKSRGACNGTNDAAANDSAAKSSSPEAASATTATEATAAMATTTSATAMPAANFDRQSIRSRLACARRSRIERRQRFGTLAGKNRHHQQCCQCAQRAPRQN